MATVDACGYVIYTLNVHEQWALCRVVHNCVGFCVARSDDVGNAKASSCGAGNLYGLPRFFCLFK